MPTFAPTPSGVAQNRMILIGMVVMAILIALIPVSYVSFYNTAVSLENGVTAQYRSNQNAYDAFWKKVQEAAQVPSRYKEDFKELLAAEPAASVGPGGSVDLAIWMRTRSLTLSDSMHLKLMNIIESGRNDFKRSQDELLDRQRRYRNHLDSFMGSIWAATSGHPKPLHGELAPPTDLDGDGRLTALDYPIITSARTTKTFQDRQDDAIQVFPK